MELCRTGYNDLPGPLCHRVIDRSGTIRLVGYGRTDHAGMGDTDVLLAVIAEKKDLPPDNEADTDGNRHFYGSEAEGCNAYPRTGRCRQAGKPTARNISVSVRGWSTRSDVVRACQGADP